MDAQTNSMPRLRHALSRFWLGIFFWFCSHTPGFLVVVRPFICGVVFACSPSVRRGTRANARRLLGAEASRRERNRLARRTLSNFYGVCCDIGRSRDSTVAELRSRIEEVEGRDKYLRARAQRRGAIIVTAHMGSFEVALASLRDMEPHVHVLFRRDAIDEFDRQRSELRARLGVHEVTVDEGWTVWIKLREALLADQVVVIQGDRVLPGQRGQPVPFLGGTMDLPASPIKLALASGSPIIPIFSVHAPSGKIRLLIHEPIEVSPNTGTGRGTPHPALSELAHVLEKQLVAYPDQWLLLAPAWRQDPGKSRGSE